MSLRSLFPATIAVAETADVDRVVELHEGERKFVASAVESRRSEFALGRMLARDAMSMIGVAPRPVAVGAHREPLWPTGVAGSITHCDGYVAAAVARFVDARSIGIDVEPKLPLPHDVVEVVVSADEGADAAPLGVFGDRLIFSAKESIYKAWFPLTGRWLGFEDCRLFVTAVDESSGSFIGEVAPAALRVDTDVSRFHGRYVLGPEHLMTAVLVPAEDL